MGTIRGQDGRPRRRRYRAGRILLAACVTLLALGSVVLLDRVGRAEASETSRSFWVLLGARPHFEALAAIPDPTARRTRLVAALRNTASQSQAHLLAELRARGVPARPFWIVNAILVKGPPALAQELARRPGVVAVFDEVRVRPPLPTPEAPPLRRSTAGVEWHVQKVRAPEVWATGTRGEGIVIAVADTGVEWSHPALRDRERTVSGTAPHEYAWRDAFSPTSAEPFDDLGHGTHVAGIAVGEEGANQVGVAPGASWIACRNMERGVGSPATYLTCFEWFLAPTRLDGQDPRPDLAPDIVNNSWICTPSEGCTDEQVNILLEAVRALRLAGILVVAAAGNEGPECSTVSAPPAIYAESFSVGASTADDQLAFFSSRGPVTRDGSRRLKPDLVAPGYAVRSSYLGGQYTFMSGTSMAAPATSGVAALLWSAVPHLRGRVLLTERLLRASARPITDTTCGGDADGRPNNSWGWGLVDAAEAVRLGATCPAWDWDEDGAVTGAEVAAVKAHMGQPVTQTTRPLDVDNSGTVDQSDLDLVQGALGATCEGLYTLRLPGLYRAPLRSSVYTITNTTPFTLTMWHTFYDADGALAFTGFRTTLGPSDTFTVSLWSLSLPLTYTGQVTVTVAIFPDEGEVPVVASQFEEEMHSLWLPVVVR
ncbi:MAG: S8 family serine peptidase [Ardenticatenia bacterium]|nr:S8 family serine peptidase [Ardenticatenia bacterium]